MNTPDLSACPFCGGTDLRFGEIQEMEVGMSWPDYFVQCRSCQGSAGSGSRKEIAAEKWNRRVVPARISQLEGLLETSKGWLENVAFKHVGPAHPGPCGPEAGCDMDCAEAASFSAFLEKVNAALKETP